MPLIKPFAGLRPATGRAADVAAPPYDVLTSEEARQRASGLVHLELEETGVSCEGQLVDVSPSGFRARTGAGSAKWWSATPLLPAP